MAGHDRRPVRPVRKNCGCAQDGPESTHRHQATRIGLTALLPHGQASICSCGAYRPWVGDPPKVSGPWVPATREGHLFPRKNARKAYKIARNEGDSGVPEKRIDVLCQCGWGRLKCPLSEVPEFCPMCGVDLRELLGDPADRFADDDAPEYVPPPVAFDDDEIVDDDDMNRNGPRRSRRKNPINNMEDLEKAWKELMDEGTPPMVAKQIILRELRPAKSYPKDQAGADRRQSQIREWVDRKSAEAKSREEKGKEKLSARNGSRTLRPGSVLEVTILRPKKRVVTFPISSSREWLTIANRLGVDKRPTSASPLPRKTFKVTIQEGEPSSAAEAWRMAMDLVERRNGSGRRAVTTQRTKMRRNSLDVLREIDVDGYRLLTWDVHRMRNDRDMIGYRLTNPSGQVIFEGEDIGNSPLDAVDSDETVRAILRFLTLRPRGTDRDYFAGYTPEQMEFVNSDAERLAIYALPDGPPLVDVDGDDSD